MFWKNLPHAIERPSFIAIVGPTASGKSALALRLAEDLAGEIICCDSIQLYKDFNIGSAKPSVDEMARVPHHLFDVLRWDEPADAALYASLARPLIDAIRERNRIPMVVGGTGLYLRALMGSQWDEGIPSDPELRNTLSQKPREQLYKELATLDPRRASELHPNDTFRIVRALEINILSGSPVGTGRKHHDADRNELIIYCRPDRAKLRAQISLRTEAMLANGLVDEVRRLLASGVDANCKPMNSIGYKQTLEFLNGGIPSAKLFEEIDTATWQYARRQMTWFNKVSANALFEAESDYDELKTHLVPIV